mgnify:CR=1 FL=1
MTSTFNPYKISLNQGSGETSNLETIIDWFQRTIFPGKNIVKSTFLQ